MIWFGKMLVPDMATGKTALYQTQLETNTICPIGLCESWIPKENLPAKSLLFKSKHYHHTFTTQLQKPTS